MGRVEVDGVVTEYEVTGDGAPVLLLHGFPDSGRVWRNQVPELARAGFQVVVPDLRGYGRSGKPRDVQAYSLPLLAADVAAVLADLGISRAHVVGHDWGAALAWGLAALAPSRVDHLAVLSVGHPATFLRTIQQREKSWYMLLFQFPGIAERWLTEDGWANFRTWAGHPDAEQVIADLEANGSLTPGLNWYRANMPPRAWTGPPPALPPVQAPVMGVWSTNDPALTEIQMTESAGQVAGPWRYERLDGPGHWLQLDAPEQVNALLLDFLTPLRADGRAGGAPPDRGWPPAPGQLSLRSPARTRRSNSGAGGMESASLVPGPVWPPTVEPGSRRGSRLAWRGGLGWRGLGWRGGGSGTGPEPGGRHQAAGGRLAGTDGGLAVRGRLAGIGAHMPARTSSPTHSTVSYSARPQRHARSWADRVPSISQATAHCLGVSTAEASFSPRNCRAAVYARPCRAMRSARSAASARTKSTGSRKYDPAQCAPGT